MLYVSFRMTFIITSTLLFKMSKDEATIIPQTEKHSQKNKKTISRKVENTELLSKRRVWG